MQRVGRTTDIARKGSIYDYFVESIERLQFWRYVSEFFVIGAPGNAVAKYEQCVYGYGSACIANADA